MVTYNMARCDASQKLIKGAIVNIQKLIEFPPLTKRAKIQNWLIHHIKSHAVKLMQKSVKGEVFLLKVYEIGESSAEIFMPDTPENICKELPDWVLPQLQRHMNDEVRHSTLLQVRIDELTRAHPKLKFNTLDQKHWQAKYQATEALEKKWRGKFKAGPIVFTYAFAWCIEIMVDRVLTRHKAQLQEDHALNPLLTEIINDEQHHIKLCQKILTQFIAPDEVDSLYQLIQEILIIEGKLGVTTAIGLWFLGLYYWMNPRIYNSKDSESTS